jgi:hypothetical protein
MARCFSVASALLARYAVYWKSSFVAQSVMLASTRAVKSAVVSNSTVKETASIARKGTASVRAMQPSSHAPGDVLWPGKGA